MRMLAIMAIPLTQGLFALVDDKNFEWLSKYKWHAHKNGNTFYARRKDSRKSNPDGKQKTILMHREILGLKEGDNCEGDHINNNGLDDRIENLRICSSAENSHNQRMRKNKTSQYKGVSWNKGIKQWEAYIAKKPHRVHLGYFSIELVAAKAYDAKAKELFGEFAQLNFPLKTETESEMKIRTQQTILDEIEKAK